MVREGEEISQALRRLNKKLQLSGWEWESRRPVYPTDMTQERLAKPFQKRFKACRATLLAQRAGDQPVASLRKAVARFWELTGKR